MKEFVKTFEKNDSGRDFVVSDMHGCYEDFLKKMDKIQFDPANDRMFSVGDLCDRGPDSFKCLKLIEESWFHSVMGNHEWLWTRAHNGFYKLNFFEGHYADCIIDYQVFMSNGGQILVISDKFAEDDLRSMMKSVWGLPRAIEIETKSGGRVGIVHAEIPFDDWEELHMLLPNEQKGVEENLLWGRSLCMFEPDPGKNYTIKNIDKVYAGHTIVPEVLTVANRVYIETGAFLKYRHPDKQFAMKKKGYKMDLTILEI